MPHAVCCAPTTYSFYVLSFYVAVQRQSQLKKLTHFCDVENQGVRSRPPSPSLVSLTLPGATIAFEMEDTSCNWIQVKKEGEPKRYFARCWGPLSTQEEIFRTVGVSTVNDVFEGYYGCIFVYGQTGTGKTFTLGCTVPGLEGIQPRCLQFLFEKNTA